MKNKQNADIIKMPTCVMDANVIDYLRSDKSVKHGIGGGFFCLVHGWHSNGLHRSIVSYKEDYNPNVEEINKLMYGTPTVKNSNYRGVHVLLEDNSEIVLDDDGLPAGLYSSIAKAISDEGMFALILTERKLVEPIIRSAMAIYE